MILDIIEFNVASDVKAMTQRRGAGSIFRGGNEKSTRLVIYFERTGILPLHEIRTEFPVFYRSNWEQKTRSDDEQICSMVELFHNADGQRVCHEEHV